MNKEYAWTIEGKVRKWTFWLLTVAVASQFYLVQELLAAFAFFAIGFVVLTFVVLSLYVLQKGWEVAAVRIIDREQWMARWGNRAVIWPVGQHGAHAKSAQELKTENTNSKDWNGKGSLDWAKREKCAERI